jgi:hypothetical protein
MFFSLFNLIFFLRLLWKDLLSGSLEIIEFVMFILVFIFPVFNFFTFIYYSFISIRNYILERPIKKLSKEHSKIASLNILKEIHSYYQKANSNEEQTTNSLEHCKKQIHSIIVFIESNYKNSEIVILFLAYEITLMRILSIIKESENIDSKAFLEILLESKKTINILCNDISVLKQKLKIVEFEKESEAYTHLINEIKFEISHHQNRIKS